MSWEEENGFPSPHILSQQRVGFQLAPAYDSWAHTCQVKACYFSNSSRQESSLAYKSKFVFKYNPKVLDNDQCADYWKSEWILKC